MRRTAHRKTVRRKRMTRRRIRTPLGRRWGARFIYYYVEHEEPTGKRGSDEY